MRRPPAPEVPPEVAQGKEPLPIRGKEPLVLTSRSRSDPLHAQLYRALRAAILRGELAPGARRPPPRAPAAALRRPAASDPRRGAGAGRPPAVDAGARSRRRPGAEHGAPRVRPA